MFADWIYDFMTDGKRNNRRSTSLLIFAGACFVFLGALVCIAFLVMGGVLASDRAFHSTAFTETMFSTLRVATGSIMGFAVVLLLVAGITEAASKFALKR